MRISVVICTYNGEMYIHEQIESIINQTLKPDEIILCDDSSKDATVNIAQRLLVNSGIQYKIEINNMTLGVVKNFEKAIGITTGDVIFLSDQDDVWCANKIELLFKEFEKNASAVMVFSDAFIVDEKRTKTGTHLWETLDFSFQQFKIRDFIEMLLNRCIVTGATMAVKRELYNVSIPFNSSWVHDGWMAIHAPLFGDVVAVNKPLIEYRQHKNNLIGAQKVDLAGKAIRYILNIKKLETVRETRRNRYKAFYDFNTDKIDDVNKKKILSCIEFWNEMTMLKSQIFIKSFPIIFKNIFNKNYQNYYTGLRGAFRDIIYMFFRKSKKLN